MAAAAVLPPPPSIGSKHMASTAHNCPSCGSNLPVEQDLEDAQRRIKDLEAQAELLKEKATAAGKCTLSAVPRCHRGYATNARNTVDKCADYEDQLRSTKASHTNLLRTNTSDSLAPSRPSNEEQRPSTANSVSAKQSRFSFLTGRRNSPAQHILSFAPPSSTSQSADTELIAQLEKERALRAKAEDRAAKVDSEIEELSVNLFSQANEMVATERKARAKLEARVEMLEKKDKDKAARLERLEKAIVRIDRVKSMLAPPPASSPMPRKV
jgi:chromosome segregation ATPase